MQRVFVLFPLSLVLALACVLPATAKEEPELLRALNGTHPDSAGLARAALVRRILEQHPQPIPAAFDGRWGALGRAVLYHDAVCVKVLLDAGASPDSALTRQTVLQLALREKQTAIVELLLSAGATVRQRDLVQAAHLGLTKCMEMLLGKGAKADAPDESGTRPVQAAAEANQLVALGFLLGRGARAHVPGLRREALQRAAGLGHVEAVRVLLDHGAPVESKHRQGLRPVELAILRGHRAVLDLLVARGAAQTVFVQAALGLSHHLAGAQDLPGARLEGESLLHAAARFGHLEVARALLAAKVDPRTAADYAGTALHIAARRGDLALARLLVEHGGDVKAADAGGETPLHGAAGGGRVVQGVGRARALTPHDDYLALTRYLLAQGADVNAAQSASLYVGARARPLHIALRAGREDIATVLIAAGAATQWDEKRLQSLTKEQQQLLEQARRAAKR